MKRNITEREKIIAQKKKAAKKRKRKNKPYIRKQRKKIIFTSASKMLAAFAIAFVIAIMYIFAKPYVSDNNTLEHSGTVVDVKREDVMWAGQYLLFQLNWGSNYEIYVTLDNGQRFYCKYDVLKDNDINLHESILGKKVTVRSTEKKPGYIAKLCTEDEEVVSYDISNDFIKSTRRDIVVAVSIILAFIEAWFVWGLVLDLQRCHY